MNHAEPRPDEPMAVEINGVRKSHYIGKMEVPTLHGIDLAIRRGEFPAIMGPSGSGKSTLMNPTGCLDRLIGGDVHVSGKDISKDNIRVHDEHASDYDREARETGWLGPEVLFGLCFEYVSPHDRLLDIGIGTGLGSMLFARAGLEVFGIDGSAEMLEICRSKDFAKDLREFDLRGTPLPYSDGFFDDVICCGVFHLIGDLEPIFTEVFRVIKPGGIFAFNILAETPEKEDGVVSHSPQGYSEIISDWGVPVFMHSGGYIKKLLQGSGFGRLKEFKFMVRGLHEGADDLACAYVTRRTVV